MKLNNRALMISAGAGAAVQILFNLISGALGFAPLMMDPNNPDAALGILGIMGTIGIVLCACGWIITVGIGFLYAYLARPVDMSGGALGGALATAIAGLLGGLLGACLAVVTPMAVLSVDIGTALASGALGMVQAICGGLIGGAIVGAIGGLIGAATVGKKPAGAPV